jgi:glycine betaine/proline transport system permease protein
MDWNFLLNPFEYLAVPFGDWMQTALDYLVPIFRGFLLIIVHPVQLLLVYFERGLISLHPLVTLTAAVLLAWQAAGLKVGIMVGLALVTIGLIGAWQASMTTISIVICALCLCTIIGLPMGILVSKSERLNSVVRPLLDFMQTTPCFVHLVLVVMFFGIGNAPGVIVTSIYAVAPLIRLTNLGIRQVRKDLVEAATAFGSSPLHMLFKIELPLAKRAIMAGLNQTVMMSLSMTVIASMISVAGLGRMVLTGIGSLDVGTAAVGGISIVLLAIIIDRATQGVGRDKHLRSQGEFKPINLIVKILKRARQQSGMV